MEIDQVKSLCSNLGERDLRKGKRKGTAGGGGLEGKVVFLAGKGEYFK